MTLRTGTGDFSSKGNFNNCNPGMPSNFFSLPRELRNQIYELVLLHPEDIDPTSRYGQSHGLTPGLLRVNKAFHCEASAMLYAQNRFDFDSEIRGTVAQFLGQIGQANAGSMQHIIIEFPRFQNLKSGDVSLDDDGFGILTDIQNSCINLSTLTTSLYSTNAMELQLDSLDNPKAAAEALELVNTHFRAISSLQEIIVKVYQDGPSDYLRKKMESHAWTISTTEHVEEEQSEEMFNDFEFDRYGSDADEDDYEDDYDIDNDSDFWRRAGD